MKSSTVTAGINVVPIFQPEDMLTICLNVNKSQPIYAYKHYVLVKKPCNEEMALMKGIDGT